MLHFLIGWPRLCARARNRMMSPTMFSLFVSEGEKTRTHNRRKQKKTGRVSTISISIPWSDDECCRLPTGNKKEPMTKVSDSRRKRILIRVKGKEEME